MPSQSLICGILPATAARLLGSGGAGAGNEPAGRCTGCASERDGLTESSEDDVEEEVTFGTRMKGGTNTISMPCSLDSDWAVHPPRGCRDLQADAESNEDR